jgi:prepilin peptidase CpaA
MSDAGSWVAAALLTPVVLIAAVTDWRVGKVYNKLTFSAILAGLVWWTLWGFHLQGPSGATEGFLRALVGFTSAALPFGVLYAVGGLHGGDVKLMGAVGALTASWQAVLATSVYAFVVGAVLAIAVMIRRGLVRRTASRIFGAALMATARVKPSFPEDSPPIPFAVGIAIGSILATAEVLLGLHTPWAAFGP